MDKKIKSDMSPETLYAMLDYLQDEVNSANSVDEITDVLTLFKTMFSEPLTVNTVRGLPNIRAEVRGRASANAYNVATNVPLSLVSTFYSLSDKMNKLQSDDPETFNNASKALHWLARREDRTTN